MKVSLSNLTLKVSALLTPGREENQGRPFNGLFISSRYIDGEKCFGLFISYTIYGGGSFKTLSENLEEEFKKFFEIRHFNVSDCYENSLYSLMESVQRTLNRFREKYNFSAGVSISAMLFTEDRLWVSDAGDISIYRYSDRLYPVNKPSEIDPSALSDGESRLFFPGRFINPEIVKLRIEPNEKIMVGPVGLFSDFPGESLSLLLSGDEDPSDTARNIINEYLNRNPDASSSIMLLNTLNSEGNRGDIFIEEETIYPETAEQAPEEYIEEKGAEYIADSKEEHESPQEYERVDEPLPVEGSIETVSLPEAPVEDQAGNLLEIPVDERSFDSEEVKYYEIDDVSTLADSEEISHSSEVREDLHLVRMDRAGKIYQLKKKETGPLDDGEDETGENPSVEILMEPSEDVSETAEVSPDEYHVEIPSQEITFETIETTEIPLVQTEEEAVSEEISLTGELSSKKDRKKKGKKKGKKRKARETVEVEAEQAEKSLPEKSEKTEKLEIIQPEAIPPETAEIPDEITLPVELSEPVLKRTEFEEKPGTGMNGFIVIIVAVIIMIMIMLALWKNSMKDGDTASLPVQSDSCQFILDSRIPVKELYHNSYDKTAYLKDNKGYMNLEKEVNTFDIVPEGVYSATLADDRKVNLDLNYGDENVIHVDEDAINLWVKKGSPVKVEKQYDNRKWDKRNVVRIKNLEGNLKVRLLFKSNFHLIIE